MNVKIKIPYSPIASERGSLATAGLQGASEIQVLKPSAILLVNLLNIVKNKANFFKKQDLTLLISKTTGHGFCCQQNYKKPFLENFLATEISVDFI